MLNIADFPDKNALEPADYHVLGARSINGITNFAVFTKPVFHISLCSGRNPKFFAAMNNCP